MTERENDHRNEEYNPDDELRRNWEQSWAAYQRSQALGREQPAHQSDTSGEGTDQSAYGNPSHERKRRVVTRQFIRNADGTETTIREFDHQPTFEEIYQGDFRGEAVRRNENGTETTIAAYQVYFPSDSEGVDVLTRFNLRALQAGYRLAQQPILVPEVGVLDDGTRRSLNAFLFYFEKPKHQPQAPQGRQNPQK